MIFVYKKEKNSGFYDLKKFILAVKREFPNLEAFGEGEIDYHFSYTEYSITTENGEIIDKLNDYKDQKADSVGFNKELSYALEIEEAGLVLIYEPINSDTINETQNVGSLLTQMQKAYYSYI